MFLEQRAAILMEDTSGRAKQISADYLGKVQDPTLTPEKLVTATRDFLQNMRYFGHSESALHNEAIAIKQREGRTEDPGMLEANLYIKDFRCIAEMEIVSQSFASALKIPSSPDPSVPVSTATAPGDKTGTFTVAPPKAPGP